MSIENIEGLSEEQKAQVTALLNTETEGLRNKNTELLNEKKTQQQAALDSAQIADDARQAAIKANEDALKAAGDMEGLKAHYETQLAEQTAAANDAAETAKGALLSRDKTTALNQALGLIHDDYKGLAEAQLSNMLKISYNDQQQPVTTFESGGKVVANNIEEFKGWAGEQPQFKKILNGVDSSGAGAQQSRAGGSVANKPYGEMSLSEQVAYNKTVTPQRN